MAYGRQWQAPRTTFACYPRDGPAKTRMALDQPQRALNLGKEFCAKAGAFLFVPSDGRAEFVSGGILDAEAPARRAPRSSNEALRAVLKASHVVRRRRPIQRTAGGTGRR
jgi:hypothetical protein